MSEHKFTNRLIHESSPYLQQHAHNPVNWFPWGIEALELARREDKPILLSIGYSACHWCHVMEHESFENEEIAQLMNEKFVNIKVDREERPDLDQIYMNAVQMMTRQGGWPLTVFLTPDLVPFYGGTYFPPEDRHHLPGFPRLLLGVADAYSQRPDEVKQSAWEILSELRRFGLGTQTSESLSTQLLDNAYIQLLRTYDPEHGGFGSAPKFPASMNLEFLMRQHYRTGTEKALELVTHTCRKMAMGGIYDQLGGGFHRYSTDRKWLVPHFEKMIYDNALLSRLYLHVYQQTGDPFYRRIVEQTLDYVVREMTDESGGFYSTQDADSEGIEGKFFVWSTHEIRELLGEKEGRLFADLYGCSDGGNFEGANILHLERDTTSAAADLKVTTEHLQSVIDRGKQILFEAREKRIKPGRDEKIITAWNGLMLESFAEAAVVLDRSDYAEVAARNARFVWSNLRKEDLLLHVYKDGAAKHVAFLDDYAYYASALLTLFETSGDRQWLDRAIKLSDKMIGEFWDEDAGGFFYVGESGEQLIVRSKDYFDNATPSGNSVAANLLLRLATLTGEEKYRRQTTTILRILHDQIERYPSAFGNALCAIDYYFATPKEVVIVSGEGGNAAEFAREVWNRYLPNKVVVTIRDDETARSALPLLAGKRAIDGRTTAYVCENYSCQKPVSTPSDFASQLSSAIHGPTER